MKHVADYSADELPQGKSPTAVIEHIQRKEDGSFVVSLNGYPFHATAETTPDVFDQIMAMLKDGEPCSDYAPPPVPAEDLRATERQWRNQEIDNIRWLRERHRDEQDLQRPATLSMAHFAELLGYMQQLREWPQTEQFPDAEHRPVAPPWIAEQVQ